MRWSLEELPATEAGNVTLTAMPVEAGEHKVLVGELAKTASHYVLKPRLGTWLKLFATVLGRMPPDYHAWVVTGFITLSTAI